MTTTDPTAQTTEDAAPTEPAPEQPAAESEPETFPRDYVERLREEAATARVRARRADELERRLHVEAVRSTGRLADPSDAPFDVAHLDDPEALAAALDDLLARKPHLASRRPTGDVAQGARESEEQPLSLLGLLRRT